MDMEKYFLVRFSRKSGKIDKSLEGLPAMLKLWALQNTTKTKDTIIFSKATGKVIYYVEGTDSFPRIYDTNLGNIEAYCPGLHAAILDA